MTPEVIKLTCFDRPLLPYATPFCRRYTFSNQKVHRKSQHTVACDSLDSGLVAGSRTRVIALKAMHVKNVAVLACAGSLLALNKRRRTLILAPVNVAVIDATLYGSLGFITPTHLKSAELAISGTFGGGRRQVLLHVPPAVSFVVCLAHAMRHQRCSYLSCAIGNDPLHRGGAGSHTRQVVGGGRCRIPPRPAEPNCQGLPFPAFPIRPSTYLSHSFLRFRGAWPTLNVARCRQLPAAPAARPRPPATHRVDGEDTTRHGFSECQPESEIPGAQGDIDIRCAPSLPSSRERRSAQLAPCLYSSSILSASLSSPTAPCPCPLSRPYSHPHPWPTRTWRSAARRSRS